MDQDRTPPAVIIVCDDSTGCDEMDDYFATEADAMLDIGFRTRSCFISY